MASRAKRNPKRGNLGPKRNMARNEERGRRQGSSMRGGVTAGGEVTASKIRDAVRLTRLEQDDPAPAKTSDLPEPGPNYMLDDGIGTLGGRSKELAAGLDTPLSRRLATSMDTILDKGQIDARREGTEEIHSQSPAIGRPLLALDLHLELLNWITTSAATERRMMWWKTYYGHRQPSDKVAALMGEQMIAYEIGMLNAAQTLYVNDEMFQLAQLVAAQDHPEPLRSTDPWCPSGFMFLPRPVRYWAPRINPDDPEAMVTEPLDIIAIAWSTGPVGAPDGKGGFNPGMGLQLWVYGTVADLTKYILRGADAVTREPPVTPQEVSRSFGPLPLLDTSAWAVDVVWERQSEEEAETLEGIKTANPLMTVPWVADTRKLLKAVWRLLDQEIVVAEPAKIGRAGERRSKRARPRMDGDAVNILRLRRIVDINTHEKIDVPTLAQRLAPKHAHRVRGHWRHLYRGDGLIDNDGRTILLDNQYHWKDCPSLRLTDSSGVQERVTIRSYDHNGLALLQWETHLRGLVEVERLANIPNHIRGLGLLIERYDVIDLSR